MCGPSSQEEALQSEETSLMKQYSSAFNQRYAGQTALLNNINSSISPTLAKGPEQTGFSPQELAAYDTQALDTTGANYANAQRALNTTEASRGDSTVESGVQQQIAGANASMAAGQTSAEELGITEADYSQGRANFGQALQGEQNVAQIENPQSFGNLTQTAEGQSFGQANTIDQQQNQEQMAIAGGITSLAGMTAGGFGNLDQTGASTGGEQAINFLGGL
jgi:hypothetical protein